MRPDLEDALPDERACLPMPGMVAGVDEVWSGAGAGAGGGGGGDDNDDGDGRGGARLGGGYRPVWSGLGIRWRDWRETVEDAVRDLERVAGGLERSGWEELFGEDEDTEDDETQLTRGGS